MNPDGNPDRQQNVKTSSQPPEIIDVSVVEEVSPELEPLGDVWKNDPLVDLQPAPTQPSQPIESSANLELSHSDLATSTDKSAVAEDRSAMTDNWNILLDELGQELDPEPEVELEVENDNSPRIELLLRSAAELKAEIARLQTTKLQLQKQIDDTQISFGQIFQTSIADLEQRRQKLQISVEQLERRRDRIKQEIDKSFAGASQDIAIRLQGFKDYLVGSLQDLVVIAEEIEFPQPPSAQIRLQTPLGTSTPAPTTPRNQTPQFAEPAFKATASKVRGSLDRYRTAPDYYAPAWQLRRTLEAVHADKISDWFFAKDGRGAVRSMGSRLQNILVAAAAVSATQRTLRRLSPHTRPRQLTRTPRRLA